MLFAAAISALSLMSVASAQMTVEVGSTATAPGGVFQYIPSTMTAKNGTVITFKFTGAPGNHTVTQSTFADPCTPVAGGFDSGWVFIPPSPALSATPEWNLTITDDSKPIWFFCKQLLPSPHCAAGMVGAINAPATGNTFAAFQNNAKSTKTSGQGEGGLVGLGASASAGIGPVPSGAVTYVGAPLASASGSASGTASGSGAASTNTAPAAGSSGSAAPKSGASSIAADSLLAMFAAALGFVLV
jgi:plastocyanin